MLSLTIPLENISHHANSKVNLVTFFTSIVPYNDALIVILNVDRNRHIIAAIEQKSLNAILDRPGEAIL